MSTRTAAILLSRQPLHPCGRTEWVRGAQRAIRAARDRQVRLLTSAGLQTWELVASVAAAEGLPQTLFLPESEATSVPTWFETLGLDPARDDVRFVPGTMSGSARHSFMAVRDQMIVDSAEILFPVSLRPGGGMVQSLKAARANGRTVIDDCAVTYCPRTEALKYEIPQDCLNPALFDLNRRYLIHWTRTANHRWPDERLTDFYDAILRSDRYPRSALDTLLHILVTARLLGSSRHMPGKIATVSFSGLSPVECLPLMRWRARYAEMTFEPYGVAVDRDAALECGIRSVCYYDPEAAKGPPGEQWLRQSIGRRTDWRAEQEYRARGDFDLSPLMPDRLIALCYRPHEAERITALTGVRAVSILTE